MTVEDTARKAVRFIKRPRHALTSYSQEGEDMIMRRFLEGRQRGFYVDVGAHHPERFSNTRYFYGQGWHGINIDADPTLMKTFARSRPRDTNLAMGVGEDLGTMTFYVFNDRALNTFSKDLADERSKIAPYRIETEIDIQIRPLAKILQDHLPAGQFIDFLSVDVEGQDLSVLRSNDWTRYVPTFVLVECLDARWLEDVVADPVAQFLKTQRYRPVAKAHYTVIFEHETS